MADSPFVLSPFADLDFGYLPESAAKHIRRQSGPIRLLNEDLKHIQERHGDQISRAGYESIEAFVYSVATEYNRIYGARSGNLGLLVHQIGRERFAIIRLQPAILEVDGSEFYAVKTASLCRRGYMLDRVPLLEQDGPILSSFRNSFDPGTRADTNTLPLNQSVVNSPPPQRGAPTAPSPRETPIRAGTGADPGRLENTQDTVNARPAVGAGYTNRSPSIPDQGVFRQIEERGAMTERSLEGEKILQRTDDGLMVIAEQHVVQTGWEDYGMEDRFILAQEDQDGKRRRLQEFETRKEAEQALRQRQGPERNPTEHSDPAVPDRPIPESKSPQGSERKAQDRTEPAIAEQPTPEPKPSQEKAQTQDNADLLKDWPKVGKTALFAEPSRRPSFERLQTPVSLLTRNNKPLVLDHGDQITVTRRAMLGIGRAAQEKRENAVTVAMQAAVQRFGEPVHFTGDAAFLKQTAEMAVKLGITLEPGNKIAEAIYRDARDRAARARGNALGPSRKSPEPQKTVQRDRGVELA